MRPPTNTNEYIRRSASKQATKKISDILKGAESDISPPARSVANANQAERKTRRKLSPPKIVPIDDIAVGNCRKKFHQEPTIVKEEPVCVGYKSLAIVRCACGLGLYSNLQAVLFVLCIMIQEICTRV